MATSPRSECYLSELDRDLAKQQAPDIAARVRRLVSEHESWRLSDALSLNAAENILSAQAQRLLACDLATRVSEGFPGDKDFPAHRQNRFIDEIEGALIHLTRRLFGARHVEWRPTSTSMANATLFFALTRPGDLILAQPEAAGGNYSYNPCGPPRAAGLVVAPLAFHGGSFEVDVERAVTQIVARRPVMVLIGGSNVLFPYPLGALRAACDEVGAKLVYDAAHVSLLIAEGLFQSPLQEGAHLMTLSTHKILSGPVGGMILTDDDDLAAKILGYSFPTLIQTRDGNKYAAAAHAFCEMLAFGSAYAGDTVRNARALGRALEAEGYEVLCAERGYTSTHQIFVVIPEHDASEFEDLCQRANLLVTRAQRVGDRAAIRLTTQEVTRRGLAEGDMARLAAWLRRVIRDREAPERVAGEVRDFARALGPLRYSFDPVDAAP